MSGSKGRAERSREPLDRADEDEEALGQAAEADETLAPGSMPGGPEYPEEASEGPDAGAPAH